MGALLMTKVINSGKVHAFFFIRAVFIRAEMMSTENFGKIRAVSTQIYWDIRAEPSYKACYVYTGRGKVRFKRLGDKK